MLPVAEAQARILAPLRPLPVEHASLPEALGRVLAEDLAARRDHPPVAVSAMDGYAVRAADTQAAGAAFTLVGEVAAGAVLDRPVGPGEAVRIFTGAPLPPGADAIEVQENATIDGTMVRFSEPVAAGRFVREAGLDFKRGWTGLAAGTRLDARGIGLAAAMGHLWLPVRRRPRVGLLATGNELRWPGETPTGSQIISSNSITLAAMLTAWGAVPVDLGIAEDRPEALAERVQGARGLDFLVTTGGASVGDHDLVREVLGRQGLELDFWQIAMRPGKPLLFGAMGGLHVLGFPGNPVSTAVCAIVYLRMALQKLQGLAPGLALRRGRLASDWAANDKRQDYLRGWYAKMDGEWWVETASRQDSSMFATFARAELLAVRPPHDPPRQRGDAVDFIDLRDVLDRLA